ncbi:MAG TPA: anaerobic ribonucleoside-triphosphate reductase activating protein [Syntrophomonadaceae bacterium]|nr:anaerobic ribonucleoside-triphosphate reductase activating protein [Syntrophomonadaceae bacterium]
MKLRISGYDKESVVDGPGIRFVIFTQGCPHHCDGCHNPETWDFTGGREVEEDEVLEMIRSSRLIKGVTFSGGEPFAQPGPLASLGRRIKEMGLDIVTYTGYTFEEILKKSRRDQDIRDLLEVSDLLVDGRYIREERDLSLAFRGSRNQRVIKVAESLNAGKVIEAEF